MNIRILKLVNLVIIFLLLFVSCKTEDYKQSENDLNQSNQTENKLRANFYLKLNKDKSTINAYFERLQDNYIQVSNLKMNGKSFQTKNSKDECYSTNTCYELVFEGIQKSFDFSFTDEQNKNYKITFQIDPIYFQLGTMTYSRSKNPPLILFRKITEREGYFEFVKHDENPNGLQKGLTDTNSDKSALVIPDFVAKEMWVGEGSIEFYSSQTEYFYEDEKVKSKLECVPMLRLKVIR